MIAVFIAYFLPRPDIGHHIGAVATRILRHLARTADARLCAAGALAGQALSPHARMCQ
jgi:hypothetical protein